MSLGNDTLVFVSFHGGMNKEVEFGSFFWRVIRVAKWKEFPSIKVLLAVRDRPRILQGRKPHSYANEPSLNIHLARGQH